MLNLQFEAGEVRRIEYKAQSNKPEETVVIAWAKWELKDPQTEHTIDFGKSEIDGQTIISLVPLMNEGKYIFELTARIAPEIVKERLNIRVV
ncbi:MAG: hypothetical protein IJ766_04990 [Clostridia bacterium]|nr:hypothetical protein [Clostridia bacterium]